MSLSYKAALDYLYGLINYEVKRVDRYAPDVVSLERPRALLAALGDPHEQYPIVHVTGTKGKGSVSAMCASVLEAAGLRVGLYSSPNLQDFRERFRANGEMIEPRLMAELVERVRPVAERVPGLTWFEVTTAIAFLYFAQANVDIAVIEVGLGGRLDATNVVRAPLVSAITSLSYDHMHLLGNTLAEIAFEKAGIIKPGIPVVSAPQRPDALPVLEKAAAEHGTHLTLVGRDTEFALEKADSHGQWFTASLPGEPPCQYWTPLIGEHQVVNAAVALASLHHVRAAGIAVSERAMQAGLRLVNWPGRLEVVRRSPWLVLDVAHNAESAERLRDALTSIFLGKHPQGTMILVFGAFTDKDVQGMFSALLPITSHLIVMQPINPRAFSTDQLAEIARNAGYSGPLDQIPEAKEALKRAEFLAGPNDLICVTGSLSVVGEMRTALDLAPGRAAYLDVAEVQALQSIS